LTTNNHENINDSNKEAYCEVALTGQPNDSRVASDLSLGVAIMEISMNYQFNIELATQYGVDEAIVLHNIIFWLRKNKSNKQNFHDGRTWTYNSASAYEKLFPFWKSRKIARVLKSLEDRGVLLAGNYNAVKYDRTKWYALIDESLLNLPLDKNGNGSASSDQPIPDSKPDSKQHISEDKPPAEKEEDLPIKAKEPARKDIVAQQHHLSPIFDVFWNQYPKKQGKATAKKAFIKALKKVDWGIMMEALRKQSASHDWTKDGGQYIPMASTWLNQERWEDEVYDNKPKPAPLTARQRKELGLD